MKQILPTTLTHPAVSFSPENIANSFVSLMQCWCLLCRTVITNFVSADPLSPQRSSESSSFGMFCLAVNSFACCSLSIICFVTPAKFMQCTCKCNFFSCFTFKWSCLELVVTVFFEKSPQNLLRSHNIPPWNIFKEAFNCTPYAQKTVIFSTLLSALLWCSKYLAYSEKFSLSRLIKRVICAVRAFCFWDSFWT